MANNNTMTFESAPAVSELNQVPGFNPLKFVRKTEKGYKLDLRYKKLWFRLKYPGGRIKLSPLRITDQLAIIEARVYFDKADAEPKASFIAQRDAKTTPGGLYIEAAQHAAIDRALSDAGFGLQFPENNSNAGKDTPEPVVTEAVAPVSVSDTMTAKALDIPEPSAKAESVQAGTEQKAEEATADQTAKTKSATQEDEAGMPVPSEETAVTEHPEQNEESVSASAYTPDMPVEEIMAKMTYEEACNVQVSEGICNGRLLSEVADRRPASLRYYAHGYNGKDNVMRAAARILLSAVDQQQKAS